MWPQDVFILTSSQAKIFLAEHDVLVTKTLILAE